MNFLTFEVRATKYLWIIKMWYNLVREKLPSSTTIWASSDNDLPDPWLKLLMVRSFSCDALRLEKLQSLSTLLGFNKIRASFYSIFSAGVEQRVFSDRDCGSWQCTDLAGGEKAEPAWMCQGIPSGWVPQEQAPGREGACHPFFVLPSRIDESFSCL